MASNEKQPLLGVINEPVSEDEQEVDPHGGSSHPTTYSETMSNFLKGNIGSGFLSLPFAFVSSGYVVGTLVLLLMAAMSTYCMHLIVSTKQYLCERDNIKFLSYGDVAKKVFGRKGELVVISSLIVTQFGFCCVYTLFIAEHLEQVFGNWEVSDFTWMLFPFLIVLVLIRHLRFLAKGSILANICLIYACIVIFYYDAKNMNNSKLQKDPGCKVDCEYAQKGKPVASIGALPIFFGNVIYSFEAIGMVLPMENMMIDKSRIGSILNRGMSVVALLYLAFALAGYLVLGAAVDGSITLNLPDDPLYSSVKMCLCLALYQTYALQFYVPIQIIEKSLSKRYPRLQGVDKTMVFNVLRSALVLFTVVFAWKVPQLGLVISLVGSLGSGSLALILPPLLYMYSGIAKTSTPLRRAVNWGIVVFGILGSITGVAISLKEIIQAL